MRAVSLVLVLLIGACTQPVVPQTPRQALYAVEVEFTALVNEVADLKESGDLTGQDLADAQAAIVSASGMLDLAHVAVDAGKNPADALAAVRREIQNLLILTGGP